MASISALPDRRHDLDALRSVAMLLGIGLHASLSFFPGIWMVQDTRQNWLFTLFFSYVHGFRMPLFFLISGYFTQMVYRKRGLRKLVEQRTLRILLPFLLGLVTVLPLSRVVDQWVMRPPVVAVKSRVDPASLAWAIRERAMPELQSRLDAGADPNELDFWFGVTPLSWAAMTGNLPAASVLLERGANVNQPNRDGSTPLHGAAFFGRDEVAALLLEKGADTTVVNQFGDTPARSTLVDSGAVGFVAGLLELPVPRLSTVETGRQRVRELMPASELAPVEPAEARPLVAAPGRTGIHGAYQSFLAAPIWTIRFFGTPIHLMNTMFFSHLWFLWFLCWMVAAFAIVVRLASLVPAVSNFKPTGVSAMSLPWFGLLAAVPQWFMGMAFPVIGPDTSMGIIPLPHVFAYYGLFFLFGVMYFDSGDREGRLGRSWYVWLPVATFVAFPMGLVTLGVPALNVFPQVLFSWAMCIGLMGLFRATLSTERPWVRYMSDAAYWMYLVHVPLVVWLQYVFRDWPLWSGVKFLAINGVAVVILLITYHLFVRYTWLGWLLNGRIPGRTRTIPTDTAAASLAAGG
jgi:surface polysaccharide O-acyltransferase-like enzyme